MPYISIVRLRLERVRILHSFQAPLHIFRSYVVAVSGVVTCFYKPFFKPKSMRPILNIMILNAAPVIYRHNVLEQKEWQQYGHRMKNAGSLQLLPQQ